MSKEYEKHYFYAAEIKCMNIPAMFVSGEYVCNDRDLSLEGRMNEVREAMRTNIESPEAEVHLITFNNIYL